MRSVLVLALLLLLILPPAGAQSPPAAAPDAWVTLEEDAVLENDPREVLALNESSDARWTWNLTLDKPFTVIEFQARGLGLERIRQLVPHLLVAEDEYPLFYLYPNERVWEADSPSQLFFVTGSGDDLVLRVGVPGPGNRTLVLEIDTIPPDYDVGPAQDVTQIGFYLETQTTELALGDLQVREAGATEWIQNPTPEYHYLQRFPVQGLDADKDHEVQVVFEDWAGNTATSPIFIVRTPPAPFADPVVVRPVEPVPNATVAPSNVTVRATLESSSPVAREGVRLFFDLQEVTEFEVQGTDVRYTHPAVLEPGRHVVSIEATDASGGKGGARWTFEVEGKRAPLPSAAWLVLGLLALAQLLRASRRA